MLDNAGHGLISEWNRKLSEEHCTVSAHYKISTKVQYYPRLRAYAAASWGLGSYVYEMLRSADWYLVADVSGKPLGPIFKGPTCSLLTFRETPSFPFKR
jgi:hypothetical protein